MRVKFPPLLCGRMQHHPETVSNLSADGITKKKVHNIEFTTQNQKRWKFQFHLIKPEPNKKKKVLGHFLLTTILVD